MGLTAMTDNNPSDGKGRKVIEIENLSCRYAHKEVLCGINLTAGAGEYVSIIGPNGAGKSTLLKCINRIVRHSQGSITLLGRPLERYAQKEIGRMIGYVAQGRERVFPYTVEDFVLMGRYPYLNPFSHVSAHDKRIVGEVLDLIGITGLAARQVMTLSGGEKQKVYLAAALAQQPQILLLDEPTTHLDPRYHAEIQKVISDICRRMRLTVLHVTHDLSHILFWSHKVIAIKDGRIFRQGEPSAVLTEEHLREIFEVGFLLTRHKYLDKPLVIPDIAL